MHIVIMRTSYSKLIIDAKHASFMKLNTVPLFATDKSFIVHIVIRQLSIKIMYLHAWREGKAQSPKQTIIRKEEYFFH